MKKTIFSALLAASFSASAFEAPTHIGVHIGSHHFHERSAGQWNDSNPGLYARWDGGAVVGSFYNSERKQSFYAAMNWQTRRWHGIAIEATAGAITGYESAVSPLAALSLSVDVWKGITVRASYLPKATPKGSGVAHLSVEFPIQ